jgi:hypothetical protein
MSHSSTSQDQYLRARVRRQLVSGLSEKGLPLVDEKKCDLWKTLLDLHVKLPLLVVPSPCATSTTC